MLEILKALVLTILIEGIVVFIIKRKGMVVNYGKKKNGKAGD